MFKIFQGFKLKTWFGDFGGDACISDTDLLLKEELSNKVETVLNSPDFENVFRKMLKIVGKNTEIMIQRYKTTDGTVIQVAPDLSTSYNIAGQLAVAQLLGKSRIYIGSGDKAIIRIVSDSCLVLGLELSVILGRKLCKDRSFVNELQSAGVHINDTICVESLDLPESYVERPFMDPLPGWVMPLKANYGAAPRPAIVGMLSGLYGVDLVATLDKQPDCIIALMKDGTSALGALKAFVDTDITLGTVEDTIAQEYHICDYGCYTLAVRSADEEESNTSLCPEIINLWRKGRVLRMGCDRITPVNTRELEMLGMTKKTARAAALAMEQTAAKHILIVEGK